MNDIAANNVTPLRAQQTQTLAPTTIDEAMRLSQMMADSEIVPKDYQQKPANVFVAIQWGMELGLGAMQSLQNITVINGRPALWGDSMLALVQSHPQFDGIEELDDGATATCKLKRKGMAEVVRAFSMEDAQQAGLLGKQGPWKQYPKRMRQMRARSFAIRDAFADALRGIQSVEEVQDAPPKDVTPAEPEVLPPYSDERLAENLPKWQEVVAADKRTPEQILAMVETKATVTDAQRQTILGLAQQETNDEG